MTPETRQRLRELAEKATREAWDPWDWASWSPADHPAFVHKDPAFVRLDPNVPVYNADLMIALTPEVVLELLDAPIDVERLARTIKHITEGTPGWLAGVDQINGMSDVTGLATAIAAEYAADTGATE